MAYTRKEYAEMAVKANNEGKILYDNNGVLELRDIVLSQEEITASNQSIIDDLYNEAEKEITLLKRAIDYGKGTDAKVEKLKAWELYTLLLSEVDTSVKDMILPEKPAD